jgi:parvulin-like peptidyl-prolyl isomerase
MGDTQDEFKKRVYERALIQTLIKEEFGDSLKVTPEDVEAEKKRYADYNAMCNATNKLVVAQGKEIMAKLEAGADLKQIRAEYSIEDDEAPDGLWGEFTFAEIDYPEISEAAFSKPIGSVAGPFDTEEGLIIIKILERIKDDNASDQAERVKLERIRLNMGQTMDCPTDAQLEKELVKRKNKEAMQPFLEKLNLKYRVEFPHGIELWKAVDSKSNLLPS